jgi:hypothetical protein
VDDQAQWEAVLDAPDDATRQRAVLAWTQLSAPGVVCRVLDRYLAAPVQERPRHEAIAFAVLSSARARRLPAIDASLRGYSASRDAELADLGVGGLGLLSMQRNGYVRQDAMEALARRNGPLVLRLLLIRCNDVVPTIAEAARRAVQPRLHMLDDLVEALPLLHAMRSMVRAATTGFPDEAESILLADRRQTKEALRGGLDSTDPQVRRLAIGLLLRMASEAPDAMRRGLADRDPVVRLDTARRVSGKHVDTALQRSALAHLADNASPSVRLLGLQVARRHGVPEPVLAAVFDNVAAVRHRARRYLAKMGLKVDVRGRALARLSDGATCLSALATLSDVGRREDRALIEPFTRHPRRRIAQEAGRTLRLLGGAT